jgi:hypothetical protein
MDSEGSGFLDEEGKRADKNHRRMKIFGKRG